MMDSAQLTEVLEGIYDDPNTIAFTWVPDPTKIGIRPQFQYDSTVSTIMTTRKCCDRFVMSPELTGSGNIHWHGIMVIDDYIKWYRSMLPKLKFGGYVCIKTKNLNEKWTEYVLKEKEVMEAVLNMTLPLVYKKKKRIPKPVEEDDLHL